MREMIEYRFKIPSITIFTLYLYSKVLEYFLSTHCRSLNPGPRRVPGHSSHAIPLWHRRLLCCVWELDLFTASFFKKININILISASINIYNYSLLQANITISKESKNEVFTARPRSLPHPNLKYFLLHPSYQIFRRMHGTLNVGKKR
jgi:hypothetical protein